MARRSAMATIEASTDPSGRSRHPLTSSAIRSQSPAGANGYCNRPAQLDGQFESICENCVHYTTDATFNAVLGAQRDHAAERDQHARVNLFQMLLNRNIQQATP